MDTTSATLDGDIGGLAFPVTQYSIAQQEGWSYVPPPSGMPDVAAQFAAAASGALVRGINQFFAPAPAPVAKAAAPAASSFKISTNQVIGLVAIGGAAYLIINGTKH